MKTGYHILSNKKQMPQKIEAHHQLYQQGCEMVYTDQLDDLNQKRPKLKRLLDQVQTNDYIYTWSFSDLANDPKQLFKVIKTIDEKKAYLIVLNQDIDTSKLKQISISEIVNLYQEIRLQFSRERTLIGLDKARKAGRIGGRPKMTQPNETALMAERLYLNTELTVKDICRTLGISSPTLYAYLKLRGIKIGTHF